MSVNLRISLWALALVFVNGCTQLFEEAYPWPEEKKVYVFPYKEDVSMLQLNCNYILHNFIGNALGKLTIKGLGAQKIDTQLRIGEQVHQQIQSGGHLYENEAAHQEINRICDNLEQFINNPEMDFEVHLVLNMGSIAFKTIGRYIYMHRNVFERESTDLVAFILGHEIGHAINGDMELSASIQEGIDKQSLMAILGKIVYNTNRYFRQGGEIQADMIGLYLGCRAGYDPEEVLDFFEQIASYDNKPGNVAIEFFEELSRTHPWTIERVNCLRAHIDKYGIDIRELSPVKKTGNILEETMLYEFPSTDAEPILTLNSGDGVKVGARKERAIENMVRQSWVYVRTAGKVEGWVMDDFVGY
jgi:predicted Zn-dependent protease